MSSTVINGNVPPRRGLPHIPPFVEAVVPVGLTIQQCAAEHLAAQEAYKQSSWAGRPPRHTAVGASEIGACALRVARDKFLKDRAPRQPPNGTQFRGDVLENLWALPILERWVESHGAKLVGAGAEQKQYSTGYLDQLRVTPDGIVLNAPYDMLEFLDVVTLDSDMGCFLVEVKTFDPQLDRGKLPKRRHVLQAQAQLGTVRGATAYDPRYCVIMYVNAANPEEMLMFAVEHNADEFTALLRRSEDIMLAAELARSDDELVKMFRPEGKIAGGQECKLECPHAHMCEGLSALIPAWKRDVHGAAKYMIEDLAEEYVRQEAIEKEAKARKNSTAQDLKEQLMLSGTSHTIAGSWSVNWSKSKPRETWDNGAVEAALYRAGLNPAKFRKIGAPSDKLTIRPASKS